MKGEERSLKKTIENQMVKTVKIQKAPWASSHKNTLEAEPIDRTMSNFSLTFIFHGAINQPLFLTKGGVQESGRTLFLDCAAICFRDR
jgi:hypothetical protein